MTTDSKPKPTAVLVDCDGTLVDVRPVRHLVMNKPANFRAFHEQAEDCPPIQEALDFCAEARESGHQIVIVTARKEKFRGSTVNWLNRHMPHHYHGPVMRDDDDNRPDIEVKAGMHRWLCTVFDIVGAIDDNPHVVALWEGLGIPTITVEGWDHEAAAVYIEQVNRMPVRR